VSFGKKNGWAIHNPMMCGILILVGRGSVPKSPHKKHTSSNHVFGGGWGGVFCGSNSKWSMLGHNEESSCKRLFKLQHQQHRSKWLIWCQLLNLEKWWINQCLEPWDTRNRCVGGLPGKGKERKAKPRHLMTKWMPISTLAEPFWP